MAFFKRYKQVLSMVFSFLLILMLAWYLFQNRADFGALFDLNLATIAQLLLCALGCCVLNMNYHRIILSTHEMKLTITDWMGVVAVANTIAYVLPMRADLLFTASYYKRTKGLAYHKSASLSAGNVIFGILFALLQMGIALLLTGMIDGVWSWLLWLIWASLVIGIISLILFSLFFSKNRPAFLKNVHILWKVVDGFHALLKNPTLLWKLLLCLIMNNLCHLMLYCTCFQTIGLQVPLYQVLFYNSVSWLIGVVAIVPGNIGIKEGVMGIATSLMGTLFQNGVAVSLLQRVSLMMIHIVISFFFAIPVMRRYFGWKEYKA